MPKYGRRVIPMGSFLPHRQIGIRVGYGFGSEDNGMIFVHIGSPGADKLAISFWAGLR